MHVMTAHDSVEGTSGPSYEMETFKSSDGEKKLALAASTRSPTILSDPSIAPAMHNVSPHEGVTVQELAPVDRGVQAWTFCVAAFVLETLVWGFSYRLVS